MSIDIHRSPCVSCPYRKDVPSGIWASQEYDKIEQYDAPTFAQPRGVFMCHQQDESLCRGWLDCHGDSLLSVRMACSTGLLDETQVVEALVVGPSVPVFATAKEASKHGRKAIARPGPKAQALMDKILSQRERKMKEISVDDFKFSTEPTPRGCWAVMEAPSGRVQRKLFRNTCYGNALSKANAWIAEKKESIKEHEAWREHEKQLKAGKTS
jgi:hypothetical protein